MRAKFTGSPDQIRGFFYASAFGDAFGYQFENRGAGVLDREERSSLLSISDDTQLTMATCEALIAEPEVITAESIAGHMALWFRDRPLRGLGSSTAKALKELALGGHWALVGAKGEKSAGCGAAMRVGPLAFFLDLSKDGDRALLRDVCRITHHHEEAYVGALAHCLALQSILKNREIDLETISESLPDSVTRDRLTWLTARADRGLKEFAEEFGCSGYVADTVPLALLGALRMGKLGLEEVLWELAELGGDVDTQCFLAAQCFGLQNGTGVLPRDQFERVIEFEDILELERRFVDFITSTGPVL